MVNGVFTIPEKDSGVIAGGDLFPSGQPTQGFTSGPENALLRVAADTLCEEQPRYNPVLLTGPTGTGKSLAVECLTAVFRQARQSADVFSTSGADFVRGITDAIEVDSLPDFRSQYESCDLFVLDGLQELRTKEYAYRELRLTLDTRIYRSAVTLITSSTSLSSDTQIPTDLCSRLAAGLEVTLEQPGVEALRVIVDTLGADFPQVVKDALLATPRDVASLKGKLAEVAVHCSQPDGAIDVPAALALLATDDTPTKLDPVQIIKRVAKYFRLQASQLRGPSRRQTIVHARAIAMFLIRQERQLTLQQIGQHFGNRDHTTVLHACQRITKLCETDSTVRQVVAELTDELRNSVRGNVEELSTSGRQR